MKSDALCFEKPANTATAVFSSVEKRSVTLRFAMRVRRPVRVLDEAEDWTLSPEQASTWETRILQAVSNGDVFSLP